MNLTYVGFLNFEFNDWKLGDVDIDDEEWKDAFTDCTRAFVYGNEALVALTERILWNSQQNRLK